MVKNSLIRSTGIVAAATLASRIMGFIRDMIVASCFGASASLDGFFVAFRIPNLLRRLLAEGALTISFIPVYTEYLVNRGESGAMELAQKTLSILLMALFGITLAGIVFSPQIISLFAYGFTDAGVISLTVQLNRIMFPYLVFVGIVAFAMGVLNSHNYFFAPAFAPVLLNVGFIIGALWFSTFFREPLFGLAWGVILGGLLQTALQVPYMVKSGFRMRLSLDFRHPGIRKIFRMMAPAVFGIAIYQINIFMSTMLASMLPGGSISYLYYSDRITEIVLGVFIVSIGNVILPEMSRATAREDGEALRSIYLRSVSAALFVALPAAAALMAIGGPVISVLFMRGRFTEYHGEMVTRALFFASMGIGSIALLRITTPTFYALQDTRTPVLTSAVSFSLNIILGYVLMQTKLRHAGLTLANSVAVTVQVVILVVALSRRFGGMRYKDLVLPAARFLLASAVMAAVIFFMSGTVDWARGPLSQRVLVLALMIAAGGAVYFICCGLLGVEEIRYLRQRLAGLRKRHTTSPRP